jgi:hypothetical protein
MKPLSKNYRRALFWGMMVVFIIGTPILIGYSKGYRLDDALSLIETGGIYIHSDLSDTSVYLGGEFVEHNGAFLRNTFIQDLAPGKRYTLWVEKPGYQSWTKTLRVKANLVTEARVLMLPKEFEWRTISATTSVSVGGITNRGTSTKIVENPEYSKHTEWFLENSDQFAKEVASTTYTTLKGKKVATTTTLVEFDFPNWLEEFASSTGLAKKTMVREREGMVAWLEDGDLSATWARENDPVPFYFCDKLCYSRLTIDWAEPILRYEFYPNRDDVVILGSERGIYAVELDNRSQRNIQTILEEPNLDFRLDRNGTLVVFDGKEYHETSW